jgi:ornithine cyclodeaminase/alanine dehydrogenase
VTLFLDGEDVRSLVTHEVAMAAAEAVVQAQRDGLVALPPRLDVDLPSGFLRVMPAALHPFMGLKVMSLASGVGTRYLILIYRQETGELEAVVDADEVTRLRTAATTVVAGNLLCPERSDRLALIGSGFEAEGHLRAFAASWPLAEVVVYSRSADRREAFAARMTDELGITVKPSPSMQEAIGSAPVSVLCTKSDTPVVDGTAFPEGAVVLSIGSTRPDLRELDRASLERTAVLLVDDPAQVLSESGDISDAVACGALEESRLVSMADWNGPDGHVTAGRDLLTFKSVGTALQDLALATQLVDAAKEQGRGRDLGTLSRLKPFVQSAPRKLSTVGEEDRA